MDRAARTATWFGGLGLAIALAAGGCSSILGIEDWTPLPSSTGTMSGGGGVGGGVGGAGSGGAPSCTEEGAPCDDKNPCTENDVCVGGTCKGTGLDQIALGPELQVSGDCRVLVCILGEAYNTADDTDVPETATECDVESCAAGSPSNVPLPAGTPCSDGVFCDGNGACVECALDTDCGQSDLCGTHTCIDGACVHDNAAAGTPLPPEAQAPGDCHSLECDGLGGTTNAVDDLDILDDGEECTTDLCTNGNPSNDFAPAGTPCGANGDLVCDGGGRCTGCNGAADCGQDVGCLTWACNSGSCEFMLNDPGQTDNDCLHVYCAPDGTTYELADDTDLPVSDGLDCTIDTCQQGAVAYLPTAADSSCDDSGGKVCDGDSHCVECNNPGQCAQSSDECRYATCTAGQCGMDDVPDGTAVAVQVDGDCHLEVCDGNGGHRQDADTGDVPDDDNQCTTGICACNNTACDDPTAKFVPVVAGTPCSQLGGVKCDGQGKCVECISNADCPANSTCVGGYCQTASCTNGIKDGQETDIDCGGGNCPPCLDGLHCTSAADCVSPSCLSGVCRCGDQQPQPNGGETDVDCGNICGSPSKRCDDYKRCLTGADCKSNACTTPGPGTPATCKCGDGQKNGSETDVDCGGGGSCPKCDCAKGCSVGSDCLSGVCILNHCFCAVVGDTARPEVGPSER